MPVSTECAAALLSFRYPSIFHNWYRFKGYAWMCFWCDEKIPTSVSRGRWSICSRNRGTSKGPWFPGMTPWEWQGALISQPDPVRLAGDRDFPAWPVRSVGDPDFPAERLAGFVPGRMVPSSTLGQRLYWNDQLVSLLSVFFPVVMFNFNYLNSCP